MLIIPIILSISLSCACAMLLVASPRAIRRFSFRVFGVIGFLLYAIAAIKTAPDIIDSPKGFWYSLRWFGVCVPFIVSLRLMYKLQISRDHIPEKIALWEN